jgi:hypothetical protein
MNRRSTRRKAGWFVVALVAVISVVGGGLIGSAGAEVYDPSKGQTIDPPVKPIGDAFPRVSICTSDGVSIKIAKGLGAILGRDIYLKDKPVKGENGFREHLIVAAVQTLWVNWSKANPTKTMDDFFGDDAVKKLIKQLDAAIKANARLEDGTKTYPNGDTLEVWCVDKNANHGGPALGYYFTPKGKDGVWVGLCKFADGLNNYYVETDRAGNVTRTQWMNYGFPDDSKDVYILVFTYDVATNSLTVEKIWGRWSKDRNGKWTFGAPVGKQKNVKEVIKPAPTKFEDLKLEGTSLLTANCGCGGDAVALADLPSVIGEQAAQLIDDFLDGDTPTDSPSPTDSPTDSPTAEPSSPTAEPSSPTAIPTDPSTAPTTPTSPTSEPTIQPTYSPFPTTVYRRAADQVAPAPDPDDPPWPGAPPSGGTTVVPPPPTESPTDSPTASPSDTPTGSPTEQPTDEPGPSCAADDPQPTDDPDPTDEPTPTDMPTPADSSALTVDSAPGENSADVYRPVLMDVEILGWHAVLV